MKTKRVKKFCSLVLSLLMMTLLFHTSAYGIADRENLHHEKITIDSNRLNGDLESFPKEMDENKINLKEATTSYVTRDDLTVNEISQKVVARSRIDSSLNPKNEIKISEGVISTSQFDDGFYTTVVDYLTVEGQNKYVYPIHIGHGEVLHAQLDLPNIAELDYDLYLYEVDSSGNMTLVDASEYATYINGTSGTLSEAVGIYNTSGGIKTYAVFVNSYIGSSISHPFKLHIGININTDPYEADENASKAINFTLSTAGSTAINVRSLNTLCDNDWYTFVVGSNVNFSRGSLTLDSASVAAGHQVEVYTALAGNAMKKESMSNNMVSLRAGRYYVRVTSTDGSGLTGGNYTLTVSPEFVADELFITGFSGGGYATYYGETRYRVHGNSTITVNGVAGSNGYVLPNATVTVTVINPNWNPDNLRYRTATVTTDSGGNFSATINTSHSTASMSYYISGPRPFTHYYDIGGVYAVSGSTVTDVIPIYIFAYSI